MISSSGASGGTRGGGVSVSAAWSNAPYPVLVVGGDGDVVDANEAARTLFPPAEGLPPWLADAHRRPRASGTPEQGVVSGTVAGRSFEAYSSPGEGGEVVWWLVEDTGHRLAEEALRTERERTELLEEISGVLLSSLNVDRCAEVTARTAADHLADAAVVVAPAQGRRHPLTYARAGGAVTQTLARVDPSSVPGLAEALQGFPPVPTRWIDPEELADWLIPPGFDGPIDSVIIAPLPGHGIPAGALILLRSSTHRAFTDGEEAFAHLFAARAGAALSAAHLYAEQASITATLLQELLPPRLERVHGVEYAGVYRPSQDHEDVGGDFYDVHPGADASQDTFVVLGDVAGKGLQAAALTGKIRSVLQALLPLSGDHQQVLTLLNDALLTSHHTRYASLVLASVRRSEGSEGAEGQVRLRLTSAGHLPPLIIRADGRVEPVDTLGQIVGALPKVTAHSVDVVLAPGETCLLYTDGITDAHGGPLGEELYGEHRLRHALRECARMPAKAVVEHVQMLAAQWLGGGRHDDMATLAITNPATGRSTRRTAHGHDTGTTA
ncbi:PP2C family protein-serine/threonine phosphatase [Streptomyces minutiscleroticus]|uniref:PP2C family protein-serine/threonine phosphatase n=2 Tax=Streptomyces minutiscleroticus TaxID=68238 RepID=UPI00167EAED1